jgi:hypothetical protein
MPTKELNFENDENVTGFDEKSQFVLTQSRNNAKKSRHLAGFIFSETYLRIFPI